MKHDKFESEVNRNFDAFEQMLPNLLVTKQGQVALMRSERIIDFFPSEALALAEGRARFPDGVFSVQEVTDQPVDLGFFSHAINTRLA